MADLKPIYLVSGDDDAKIDEWRGRLRSRAELEHGPGALETFDAGSTSAEAVAAALAALTFNTGTRYLMVDDVGAWKPDAAEPLVDAISPPPPDTVLMLVVRGKPLKELIKAVEKAGGEIQAYAGPKPWEIVGWVRDRGKEIGIELDPEACQLLLSIVGPGQHRLTREMEKIAIAVHPERRVNADDVEELAAGDHTGKPWDLGDLIIDGDREGTLRLAEELIVAKSAAALVGPVVGRLREVLFVAEQLDAGVSEGDIAKQIKPGWKVKKLMPVGRRADQTQLKRALIRLADLEFELRGGPKARREESIAVTLTLAAAAA